MKTPPLHLCLILPLLCLAWSGCADDSTAPEADLTDDDPIETAHPYTIVDTGQSACYGLVAPIACPAAGEDHRGQDSQHDGFQPSYQVSSDGLTVTDLVTGLVWQRMADTDGNGELGIADKLTWEQAQARPDALNAVGFAGHDDWRLPGIKELQSIVDYTRSPDNSGSAAIDPLFNCTVITNERGQDDHGFYWSSTTHANAAGTGSYGSYVAFGRALGFMNGHWVDVHGAGAQRSDPKDGDPADYPEGHGPQGDAIRIFNQVRLVRGAG